MGCWYSTCFISNLPIMPGDDIRIILLAPNYPEKDGMTCYPNERYTPIGFPIFAEYDDDIQVRNIREINEYARRYLHEFATVYEKDHTVQVNGEDIISFKEYKWDNLEDFVRDVIYGQLFVDRNGKKMQLEHVMIHGKLYHDLLKNVYDRVPCGFSQKYGELLERKILQTIEWMKEEDDVSFAMRQKYGVEVPGLRRFTDRIHIDTFSRWNSLDKMAKYYIETEDGIILDDILNYILWSVVMNYSRKGYHCYSGGGSQSQEMMLQKIIAEFTILKCNEREADQERDYQENVLEETIYFFD